MHATHVAQMCLSAPLGPSACQGFRQAWDGSNESTLHMLLLSRVTTAVVYVDVMLHVAVRHTSCCA